MKFNDDIPNCICVYKITNLKTNLILIGSTTNLHKRIIQYKYDIIHERIKSVNKSFLNDVICYGIDSLDINIIEEFKNISNIELKNKETEYILKYNSIDTNIGYNIRLDFDGKYICSLSTKNIKRQQLKEQWESGIRNNHSNKMKNYWKNVSDERKNRQSKIMSNNLTKYYYNIYDLNNKLLYDNLNYVDVKRIMNKNMLTLFAQKEKNINKNNNSIIKKPCFKIVYKNKYIIERKFINKN